MTSYHFTFARFRSVLFMTPVAFRHEKRIVLSLSSDVSLKITRSTMHAFPRRTWFSSVPSSLMCSLVYSHIAQNASAKPFLPQVHSVLYSSSYEGPVLSAIPLRRFHAPIPIAPMVPLWSQWPRFVSTEWAGPIQLCLCSDSTIPRPLRTEYCYAPRTSPTQRFPFMH